VLRRTVAPRCQPDAPHRPPSPQVTFGLIVAAREVLYLATTCAGALACPADLLLDVATTWHEAESRRQGGFRGAREGGDRVQLP
jgi:hypothetical protein